MFPGSDPMGRAAELMRRAATGHSAALRPYNIEVGPPASLEEIGCGEYDPSFKPCDWPDVLVPDEDEYLTMPDVVPCEEVPRSD